MTTLTPTTPTFGLDTLSPVINSVGPDAWRSIREQALARYLDYGIPTTKHEEWKYTALHHLVAFDNKPAYGVNVFREDIASDVPWINETRTVAFVNGQTSPELDTLAVLPEGVFFGTIEEACEAIPAVIDKYLTKFAGNSKGKLGTNLEAPFVDLNTAFLSEGAVLFVPKGVEVETPLQALFVSRATEGAFVAHPRLLAVLEEGAEATLLETYVGTGAYWNNSVVEVVLGEGAILEHNTIQLESLESTHIGTCQVHQAATSTYTSNLASFGGKLCRYDRNAWVGGENAQTWLNGAYVGTGEQHHDNHTRIDHALPNCNSFEVYKGILDDKSHGVFNGKIFVYEDAQKTDAKQTNQALLLSREAQIDTKPQLEIFADDVKCTHGATVGQIRKDALFYLRARGIPEKEARALLVYAFAAEVFERMSLASLVSSLEARLLAKLNPDKK